MTDPLAYIEAAHKRAEQTAQAAGGDGTPVWSTGRHHAVRDENGDAVAYDEGRPTPAQAAHIAANDPASVLRRIGGERALIADLTAERHEVNDGDCWYTCAAATEERDGGETCDDARLGKPCDCGRDTRVGRRLGRIAEGWGWSGEEQR